MGRYKVASAEQAQKKNMMGKREQKNQKRVFLGIEPNTECDCVGLEFDDTERGSA